MTTIADITQPTPGPWIAQEDCIGDWCVVTHRDDDDPAEWLASTFAREVGAIIASSIGDHTEARTRGNEKANACLIAAAPDLLAALEAAVAAYGRPGGPWNVSTDPSGWLHTARAAIAKARGQA